MTLEKITAVGVRSIDHVTIIVRDLEATRQFYVDLLGMRQVPRPAFDFPGLWFQIGDASIHATVESEMAGGAGWGDQRGAKSPSRGHHFAFLVDDFDHAVEVIQQASVEIVDGPKRRPDGALQVYIADPDGHVVELAGH